MREPRNELLMFLGGLAMLVAGLFLFSQRVTVSSGFSSGVSLGGVHIASGLLIVPFIIGIVWMFASGGSLGSKLLTGIGVFIIIAGIIASTSFWLHSISLYEWVLILVLIFGGAGLLARVLFSGKSPSEKDKSSDI